MKSLRIAVLVSPDPSDIYFANKIMEAIDVEVVFVETKFREENNLQRYLKFFKALFNPVKVITKLRDSRLRKQLDHRSGTIAAEGFGDAGKQIFPKNGTTVIYTDGPKDLNSSINVARLKAFKVDLIVCCGCSILNNSVISIPRLGVLNLHGGLSQRYRGILPILFSINNNEPEYIGLTVHYVRQGIDDGEVIYQARPVICLDDNPESIYIKIVKLGIENMLQAIADIAYGKIKSYKLIEKGKLYTAKMATAEVIAKAWEGSELVIASYLANKDEQDKEVLMMLNKHYSTDSIST
ncbi:formyltransferase family protein [Thalassotalea fonticola]|uniref:phosphoribosylglycinamide formyltransferase 1 n=1 Tax=Thalassotalea fonticola TaxID=3065649 RepID=A0ABZ0GM53_9GAMM|nr:formyltransferase family protein [Colwelliaceae bacterium S1-1]